MFVDATQHLAPALWQGLMLIGMSIWMPWNLSESYRKPIDTKWHRKWSNRFFALYSAVVTVLVVAL